MLRTNIEFGFGKFGRKLELHVEICSSVLEETVTSQIDKFAADRMLLHVHM